MYGMRILSFESSIPSTLTRTATPRFGHFLRNLSKIFFVTAFFSHYYSAAEGAFWQGFGEKEQKNIGREFRPTGSSFILS